MRVPVRVFAKQAIIECTSRHNKYAGEIMKFFDHIDEANKIVQGLPIDIQNELKTMIANWLKIKL